MFFYVRWGTNLFGACNGIKGLGNVQTKFFHINYIPLCPMQSYFIIPRPRDRGGPIAKSIPLDSVSVGKAYILALLCLMTFAFVIFGIVFLADDDTTFQGFIFFAMAVIFGGAACASCKIQRYASYERAKEIGRQLGSRPIADLIDRIYNEQGHHHLIPTVEAEYYDELDLTEADSQDQNNDDSEAGIVMAEAAPIREPNSSALATKSLAKAAAVTDSGATNNHEGLPVASAVFVQESKNEKIHDEKQDKHEHSSASLV